MTPEIIEQLAWRFTSLGLSELEFSDGATSLRLVAGSVALCDDAAASPPCTPAAQTIRAQFAGLFMTRHPHSREPIAEQGSLARAGQAVGLLGIGPIVRPVTAAEAGILGRALVADGDLVGFGEALFEMVGENERI